MAAVVGSYPLDDILLDRKSMDGALTAYARECIIVAASELPPKDRGVVALADAVATGRNKLSRWLDALGIRKEIEDLELDA